MTKFKYMDIKHHLETRRPGYSPSNILLPQTYIMLHLKVTSRRLSCYCRHVLCGGTPQLLLNLLLNLPKMLCLISSFPILPQQHLLQYDVVDVLSEESLSAFSLGSSGSLDIRK